MSEDGGPPELDDLERIVASLNEGRVDFMIIGGYAVIFHGYVRNTKDLDILLRPTPDNSKRAVAALEALGLTCAELKPELFTSGKGITFGDPPMRVDILGKIPGVDFEEAWSSKETSRFGRQEAHFIGLEELIRNKQAVARPQDLVDAEKLKLARRGAL